jgi:hypothetical protein
MENLAHNASFHSRDKNAPSKPGIKHLEPISIGLERERGGGVVDIFPEMEMIDGAALFGRSA